MDQPPLTRPSLILRLRNADDLQAWQEFVQIYQPTIQRLARTRGLQDADAMDVTQEVLTRVAKNIASWDPNPARGTFRGWLATITRNLVIQAFRDDQRRPVTGVSSKLDRTVDQRAHTPLDATQFDLERERQLLLWAAQEVRPRFMRQTWQAFWLTAVEGRSVESVAAELGTTKSQVYVARSRVMSSLKRVVERSEFDTTAEVGT